ncbi:MAG: hypothetical protein V3S49_06105 [Thermodesulfobacteriota bacterium]
MKLKIVTGLLILWVSLSGLSGCNLDTGKTTIVDNNLQSSEYVEGEIIVKFKGGVSLQKIEEINKAMGTEIVKVFSSGKLFLLRLPKGVTVPIMLERYKRLPEVEYGEPNYIVRMQ